MIELTPKERRELRARAHRLHPVVIVGQHGLTARVLHEIDVALKAHALVKVRSLSEDRSEREAMLTRIASALRAAPVQHLGKLLIVWRPEEAPKPVKRAATKPAKARRPAARAAPREQRRPAPVARRARGQPVVEPSEAAFSRRRNTESANAAQRPPRGKSAPNPRRRRGV